jgi:uncharacterized membrane protein YeaQ/YmgE (transglycosylase-associated protein family)
VGDSPFAAFLDTFVGTALGVSESDTSLLTSFVWVFGTVSSLSLDTLLNLSGDGVSGAVFSDVILANIFDQLSADFSVSSGTDLFAFSNCVVGAVVVVMDFGEVSAMFLAGSDLLAPALSETGLGADSPEGFSASGFPVVTDLSSLSLEVVTLVDVLQVGVVSGDLLVELVAFVVGLGFADGSGSDFASLDDSVSALKSALGVFDSSGSSDTLSLLLGETMGLTVLVWVLVALFVSVLGAFSVLDVFASGDELLA